MLGLGRLINRRCTGSPINPAPGDLFIAAAPLKNASTCLNIIGTIVIFVGIVLLSS